MVYIRKSVALLLYKSKSNHSNFYSNYYYLRFSLATIDILNEPSCLPSVYIFEEDKSEHTYDLMMMVMIN